MLAELFLTPDALADDSDGRGMELIRDLKTCLFPHYAAPRAVVCNLGGSENWQKITSRRIAQIRDQGHRQLAMQLFQKITSELCVFRPNVNRPGDNEHDWISAGLETASRVPVDKFVVSNQVDPPEGIGVNVQNLLNDSFWASHTNPRLVYPNQTSQDAALRTICTHSDWITVFLPQIRGGCDDEIVTAKQIIRLANGAFQRTAVDLQVCLQGQITEQNLRTAVRDELRTFIKEGIEIRLTIWPRGRFVNRELLAGRLAKTSSGDSRMVPLWLVTMSHVEVQFDRAARPDQEHYWSLFARTMAQMRFDKLKNGTPLSSEVLKPP